MNFDRAAGAFKQPGNALNILLPLLRLRDPAELEMSRLHPRQRVLLRRFLKNALVRFKFSRDRNAKLWVTRKQLSPSSSLQLILVHFSKIRKVSDEGARDFMFDVGDGQRDNVAVRLTRSRREQISLLTTPASANYSIISSRNTERDCASHLFHAYN